MSKKMCVGVDGVARQTEKAYIGINGIARKIQKAYVGDENGLARRLFFDIDIEGMTVGYTGNYTDEEVTMSGEKFRLLTLTSSGTLTLSKDVDVDVWMIGGGNGGADSDEGDGRGGGGGYSLFVRDIHTVRNTGIPVVVGAGGTGGFMTEKWVEDEDHEDGGKWVDVHTPATVGGQSKFGSYATKLATVCANGGSGGGASFGGQTAGTGDGVSKYPFEDSTYFEHPHGAGGGGGGYDNGKTYVYYNGGAGGSNGGNGGKQESCGMGSCVRSAGGNYGGGAGGRGVHNTNDATGGNATYYGGGGGGGAISFWGMNIGSGTSYSEYNYNGGNGYQGVVYVRIPYDQ